MLELYHRKKSISSDFLVNFLWFKGELNWGKKRYK
ncbi:TPA: hypothetical protein JD098_19315 [Clostridioides difficile]|uniref:Uncharacterized protein n=1 Tax=Clostridioides difficile (strain 630) TaxID=272563 RepID=Q17ZS6_CLOD6|nr:hypothetical protein [Clostridioides difficile]MCG6595258.1 hypothetical protein [Clostridioides difficile]CAJ66418.1 Hypothetical protein CD630_p050 [Clostridioides difficile 630]HAU5097453.1 hypothetical protein [Clostridioides difficile]HAU5155475.1 hypothetical protein [Clostridioides difficile]